VRNTDVLLNQIEQNLGRKRLAHRDVWTTFRDYLQERRDSEMRKASRKLGKLNLAGWYVHAKGVLAVKGTLASAPEPAPEPAPKPISKPAIVARVFGRTAGLGAEPVSARNSPANPAEAAKAPQDSHPPELRALLTESLLQSWEALNNRVVQSQREPSATTIHAVRIAGKRLRYLIEVMQALRVAGSDPALDWLRRLQQDLGEWHDLEVMEQTMIGMVARPKFLRDHLELGLEAEKLVLRNRKVKQDYQDRFFELMEQKTDMEGLANWIHSFTGQRVALGVGVGVAPGQPVETNAG
jgi:CHAD domain-containing protein